jgi:transcriptional regulator with XRE-family HTH domain
MRKPTPLKLAIVASGETQREIARRVGIDEPQFNKIVAGSRTPNLLRALTIADAVHADVVELFPVHEAAVSAIRQVPDDTPETDAATGRKAA